MQPWEWNLAVYNNKAGVEKNPSFGFTNSLYNKGWKKKLDDWGNYNTSKVNGTTGSSGVDDDKDNDDHT